MRNFTKLVIALIAITGLFPTSIWAQSIIDPADPIVNYDPAHPKAQPDYGVIGKWVRTPRLGWNTDSYKAYVYKGVQFRVKFPKTYNPTANDGKKYPVLLFWHGLLEAGDIYDDEFQMYWGGQFFRDNVDNGTFDGYVIFMQAPFNAPQGGWFTSGHYQIMKEILDYMTVHNKVDPFAVTSNGLSAGAVSGWDMFLNNPTYVADVIAMSPPGDFTDPTVMNTSKFAPIWYANGGLDDNPTPFTANTNNAAYVAAGANFTRKYYPTNNHDTWNSTWGEPDFWPFVNRAYASNPWTLYGKTLFNPDETINVNMGLVPGYDAYEWRKNGVLIAGATTNTLNVTSYGVYDARVRRGTLWSDWSRIPVKIERPPLHIEAENYTAMNGIQTENSVDAGGGLDVGWQDNGDWMDYSVKVDTAGTYNLNFRIATPFVNPQFQVKNSSGTVLGTVTVPNTGSFQNWRTITARVTLPAGQQTIRLYTNAANGGWNINWWEVEGAGTLVVLPNQPPVVSAGSPQTINLPTTSVILNGSATDGDGLIASVAWTKISGGTATFANPNSASTTVSGLALGTYTFRLTATDDDGATSTSDVTVTVNAAIVAGPSIKIQAESFTFMSGIGLETTTDVGGGQDIGWQDNGDWMDYSVNLAAAGSYTVNFRVASYFSGATFQVKNSGGTVLATVTVPNTGSFQNWTTVGTTITLPAGIQTIRIYTSVANGGWNFNWWEILGASEGAPPPPPPPTNRIQAETYTAMSGIGTETTSDVGGGLNVGWQDTGDWLDYAITVPTAGTYGLNFRVSSYFSGAQFQVRKSNGTVLATLTVPNTGSFQVWTTISTQVTLPAGSQTIRIYTSNANGGWNFNWWEITQNPVAGPDPDQPVTRIQYAPVSEPASSMSIETYPNPVTDGFQMVINNSKTGRMQVQLLNASGMAVKKMDLVKPGLETFRSNISISNLPRGVYILQVTMDGWKGVQKIVKQ